MHHVAWHAYQLLNGHELIDLFQCVRPDALIHTAAIADIDIAEANRPLARAVNVEVTRDLVNLCHETGCKLVFCSTDTIFDGERAPYKEGDPPRPVNYYGETKVDAEQVVRRLGSPWVIARLAIVMGLPIIGSGNSFLARMLPALKDGQKINVPPREVRTPVDVITAGRALLELAGGTHEGIFHLAGNSRVGRLELGRKIAARFGFSEDLITEASGAHATSRRATRPRDVSLDNTKARAYLQTPMRSIDEALSLIQEAAQSVLS